MAEQQTGIPQTPDQAGVRREYVVSIFETAGEAERWLNDRANKGYRVVAVTGSGEYGLTYTMERRVFVPGETAEPERVKTVRAEREQ